jgi:hypothetical protein
MLCIVTFLLIASAGCVPLHSAPTTRWYQFGMTLEAPLYSVTEVATVHALRSTSVPTVRSRVPRLATDLTRVGVVAVLDQVVVRTPMCSAVRTGGEVTPLLETRIDSVPTLVAVGTHHLIACLDVTVLHEVTALVTVGASRNLDVPLLLVTVVLRVPALVAVCVAGRGTAGWSCGTCRLPCTGTTRAKRIPRRKQLVTLRHGVVPTTHRALVT